MKPAAIVTVGLAYLLPLVFFGYVYSDAPLEARLPSLAFLVYLLIGFSLLSDLDNKVPHDDPGRFRTAAFRNFILTTIIFLPSAIYRYMAFILFCVLFLLFSAWRWYLYLVLALISVLILNEAYLRFVKVWTERPDCILYSIPTTCAAAVLP